MIFKGRGQKMSKIFFGKSLIKIIGQLSSPQQQKIDSFGAHEAERVDNYKKTVGIFADGVWVLRDECP